MQLVDFIVHDVSRFPEVRCVPGAIYPGYGRQWRDELEALIARDEPFFMIFEAGVFDESPDDTRIRAVWLKGNKVRLAKVCRSIVSIEPDATLREKQIAQSAGLEKAFGIPRLIVQDEHAAAAAGAHSLLSR